MCKLDFYQQPQFYYLFRRNFEENGCPEGIAGHEGKELFLPEHHPRVPRAGDYVFPEGRGFPFPTIVRTIRKSRYLKEITKMSAQNMREYPSTLAGVLARYGCLGSTP